MSAASRAHEAGPCASHITSAKHIDVNLYAVNSECNCVIIAVMDLSESGIYDKQL